eukprot:7129659-Prymnesium_polylepis.1
MRVSERQPSVGVDLTSPPAREVLTRKCARTGVKRKIARLFSVMMTRVLDLDSSRHFVKKWKVSRMNFS